MRFTSISISIPSLHFLLAWSGDGHEVERAALHCTDSPSSHPRLKSIPREVGADIRHYLEDGLQSPSCICKRAWDEGEQEKAWPSWLLAQLHSDPSGCWRREGGKAEGGRGGSPHCWVELCSLPWS